VGLALAASVMAVFVFAVPLGLVVARYFVSDEHSELVKLADSAAVTVSGDLSRQHALTITPERGSSLAVYDASGRKIQGSGPDRAETLLQRALRGHETSGTVGGRLAAAVPVTDGDTVTGAVLATTTRADVNGRIARAWAEMLGLGAVAIVATWLLARALARRLARPIEQLARATQRLGDGDFTARTSAARIPEIDAANTALNRAADRIGSLVERERSFSSDASHQLRTPLAGLRLELEAALDDPETDQRAAIRRALRSADQIEATVDDLLALARDTTPSDPIDVSPLLDQIRQRWNGPLAAAGRCRSTRPTRCAAPASRPPPPGRFSTYCSTTPTATARGESRSPSGIPPTSSPSMSPTPGRRSSAMPAPCSYDAHPPPTATASALPSPAASPNRQAGGSC